MKIDYERHRQVLYLISYLTEDEFKIQLLEIKLYMC